MTPIFTHLILGLILGATAAPPSTEPAKSSSEWLRAGEALQREGHQAGASEAYRAALAALPAPKQRANEGARAAMLAAEARWQAFEADANVAHLDAGIDVLAHWLALTGPQSRASLLEDVQRDLALVRAVRDPLAAASVAVAEHDLDTASSRYHEVLDALSHQDDRDWSIGASVALHAAGEIVAVDDPDLRLDADASTHRRALERARDILVRWRGLGPAADTSERAAAIDERLAELQARIDATRRAPVEPPAETDDSVMAPPTPRRPSTTPTPAPAPERPARRALAIALLSGGTVATAAGTALLAEGAAFAGLSKDRAAAAEAHAAALAEQHGDAFDHAQYQAELDEYRAAAKQRDVGMIIGGSVLAAAGVASSVVGIVALARARRSPSPHPRDRARLAPVVSPSLQRLSLTWRF